MYQSTITINHDIEELEKLFITEQKDLGRSRYNVTRKGKALIFSIEADDATAFKTVMNTLAKIFSVWEKTKILVKNES